MHSIFSANVATFCQLATQFFFDAFVATIAVFFWKCDGSRNDSFENTIIPSTLYENLRFQLRDGDRAVAEIDHPSANQPHQRKLAETITGYDRPEHKDAGEVWGQKLGH